MLRNNNIVFRSIILTPMITRMIILVTLVFSLLSYIEIIKPHNLSYSRYYLYKLQLHRLLTTFFYHGKPNYELILSITFLYRYSSMLEEHYHRKADYFWLILVICSILLFIGNIFYVPFLASSLSNTLTYLWTRKNPNGFVQIFGIFSFNAFYLPFVFPFVSLTFERRISTEDLLGIVVGQIAYFFFDVYPNFGKNFLKTPCWCHRIFSEEDECCKKSIPPNTTGIVKDIECKNKLISVDESMEQNMPSNVSDDRNENIIQDDIIQSNYTEQYYISEQISNSSASKIENENIIQDDIIQSNDSEQYYINEQVSSASKVDNEDWEADLSDLIEKEQKDVIESVPFQNFKDFLNVSISKMKSNLESIVRSGNISLLDKTLTNENLAEDDLDVVDVSMENDDSSVSNGFESESVQSDVFLLDSIGNDDDSNNGKEISCVEDDGEPLTKRDNNESDDWIDKDFDNNSDFSEKLNNSPSDDWNDKNLNNKSENYEESNNNSELDLNNDVSDDWNDKNLNNKLKKIESSVRLENSESDDWIDKDLVKNTNLDLENDWLEEEFE